VLFGFFRSGWAIPVTDRPGHVCGFKRHTNRDAFIPRFCRQHAGQNWTLRRDLGSWWRLEIVELRRANFAVILDDMHLLATFSVKYQEDFDDLARAQMSGANSSVAITA